MNLMNPSICECLTLLQCIVMTLRPLLPVLWLDGPMGLIRQVRRDLDCRLQMRTASKKTMPSWPRPKYNINLEYRLIVVNGWRDTQTGFSFPLPEHYPPKQNEKIKRN